MTTPDHIGADPALGVGAGQTRRGTPVDLAREVLDIQKAHEGMCKRTDLALPASVDDLETLANAAPILARAVRSLTAERDAYIEENTRLREQVARIKALADRLETEGTTGVRVPSRTPHDSGWHDSQIIAATRIRTALNGDHRG